MSDLPKKRLDEFEEAETRQSDCDGSVENHAELLALQDVQGAGHVLYFMDVGIVCRA